MIIIQVAGGLGNQLQQYALYRKFVRLGIETRLDLSWFDTFRGEDTGTITKREFELRYFDRLIFEICSDEEREELIGSDKIWGKLRRKFFPSSVFWFHESKMYHPEIFTFENMYLSGYFACEKYYADILYDLREKIQFPLSDNPLNAKIKKEMQSCSSVSLHVRRGDYLQPENARLFGNICTASYYRKAVETVKERIPDAHFYLFSDDIAYVREKFKGEEYTVIDINHGKESFFDIDLMSSCKHNICANSTFSFWGARLNSNNNKIMIRPTIQKNGQIFEKEEMEELWSGWQFISPQGKLI